MPETSIVIKATDKYTDAVKKMTSLTKSFDKSIDGLGAQLEALSKNKVDLKLDLTKASKALRDARKEFEALQSAENRLKLETAQANYDHIARNLKVVSDAARETEKQISKLENKVSGTSGFAKSIEGLKGSAALNQYGQMIASSIGQGASTYLNSALGSVDGGAIATALGSIASGAAIGFSVGGVHGALIGGGVGLVSGAISAISEVGENKDSFFKDYYNNLYEERISAGEAALTAGSTTAGSREQSYKAFEKRLGEAEAKAYLSDVKHMAAQTNYGYDEILGYSKLLLEFLQIVSSLRRNSVVFDTKRFT